MVLYLVRLVAKFEADITFGPLQIVEIEGMFLLSDGFEYEFLR